MIAYIPCCSTFSMGCECVYKKVGSKKIHPSDLFTHVVGGIHAIHLF